MRDIDEGRENARSRHKYKFAFVFTAAVLAVCCVLLILLLVNRNARSRINIVNYNTPDVSAIDAPSEEYGTDDIPGGKIDLNLCTPEQLCSIPGVGEKTAEKIIEYRDSVGGFDSVDELINVSGIGEVKLAKIRQYVTVNK